ncbi:MAG TPA: hypothetical protein VFE79_20285, partial [Paraburkholderia sp.]|nr:hypothetical protein [Paraburkholderia sp.]
MAAASAKPAMRDAHHAAARGYADAAVTGAACVLLMSGAATFVMCAGLGQHTSALWMSALTLAAMILVPSLMSRLADRHGTLAIAATLLITMSAMTAVPTYLRDAGAGSSTSTALLMATLGAALCARALRKVHRTAQVAAYEEREVKATSSSLRATGAVAALALLSGLSSGTLARFDLFGMCGASGAVSAWQMGLSLIAVCVAAVMADRSRSHTTLMVVYGARALMIGAMAWANRPELAPLAAKLFL